VVDVKAPSLTLAVRFTKTGTFAVRRTGKFQLAIKLDERADLTITATGRRGRALLKTTRKGVAPGSRKLTLTLTKKVRAALRAGETVTLRVDARDAAGNVATKRGSSKVR
jgi:hypothetical protein